MARRKTRQTGGSGGNIPRKLPIKGTKTLQKTYEAALRKYKRRQLDRQALDLAINKFSFGPPQTTFKNLDFKEIYEKGITRKVGGKTVRYYGKEAVQIQIQSLRKAADASVYKERFIRNYTNAMMKAGYTREYTMNIRATLIEMSPDEINKAIDDNTLPEINFIYADALQKSNREKLDRIARKKTVLTGEEKAAKEFYKQMLTEREKFFEGLKKK